MEEENKGSDTLRPYSSLTGRFPSLRRTASTEPYRHTPVATAQSPTSEGGNSDVTFAVLYDDGPDYHMGYCDDVGSLRSGHRRDTSIGSLAPSFRTRDSRIVSDDQDRHPDFIANQRLLAEGFLNSKESLDMVPKYPSQSTETLPMNNMSNGYPSEKQGFTAHSPHTERTGHSSHESWCTCDDEILQPSQSTKDITKIDLEAQNEPQTPKPFLGGDKKPGGGPGGEGDEFKVTFNGPNDPLNPKNWPSKKKWAATACIASFTFLSPLASSMVAPALGQIAREFNITDPIESQIVLSIFVLAYAVGPMLLGPLSELYGRVIIAQSSNVFFLVFNIACGFATSKQQLMAFRFLSGLGGSAPLALGGGVLGDIFKPEERGKAMGLYAMGPLLGPAVGPIVGGWVAEKSTWRWMFWATSIVNVVILGAGFIWFKETYAPYLLHQKAKRIRKETGNPAYRAEGEGEVDQPVWKKVSKTMGRAFGMLWSEPIVQVLSVYMAFSYGILYLMLSTFPGLFMIQYQESVGIAGLNYISLGLGFFIGAPVCGKSSDTVYQKLKAKDPQRRGKPEYRMPLIIPFSFLVPIGILIYGWSAQAKTHWIVPNIGAFIFGMGTIAAFQCVTTYLVDTYFRFAASAVAAVTILRSLAGFSFPLFAPYMYQALDYGWGNTVLAIAAIGIGVPVPILLWIFGEKLRAKSKVVSGHPSLSVCV